MKMAGATDGIQGLKGTLFESSRGVSGFSGYSKLVEILLFELYRRTLLA